MPQLWTSSGLLSFFPFSLSSAGEVWSRSLRFPSPTWEANGPGWCSLPSSGRLCLHPAPQAPVNAFPLRSGLKKTAYLKGFPSHPWRTLEERFLPSLLWKPGQLLEVHFTILWGPSEGVPPEFLTQCPCPRSPACWGSWGAVRGCISLLQEPGWPVLLLLSSLGPDVRPVTSPLTHPSKVVAFFFNLFSFSVIIRTDWHPPSSVFVEQETRSALAFR